MGLKAYKPTTSGRRGMTIVTTEELTKKRPEKALTSFHLRTGGRNNDGRTTVRFRGAGHRQPAHRAGPRGPHPGREIRTTMGVDVPHFQVVSTQRTLTRERWAGTV